MTPRLRFLSNTGLVATVALVQILRAADAPAPSQPSNATEANLNVTEVADPLFTQPYIDIDEWRDTPVRHHYIHGGFKETETRFSFYFPPKEQYQGRFFQHITPIPDSENIGQKMPPGQYNKIGFSIASGAYFIETNGGGHVDLGKASGRRVDSTVSAYRANAAAAQYSRVVAQKLYGGPRPFGYAYGGSGGAYRTVCAIENTHGVWDGVVPYVLGSTMAIPNMFTVRMHAMRILKDKFPQIVDAVEPGGSGDPYAGLNEVEAGALREVTRMGFPPQSWFGYKTMGIHGFAALYGGMVMADPGFFRDFWTKPGYLGFDHPEQFEKARIQFKSTIAAVINGAEAFKLHLNTDASTEANQGGVDTAFTMSSEDAKRIVAFRLTGTPPSVDFLGGDLIVQSGAAKDKKLTLAHIVGDIVVLGVADSDLVAKIALGDEVQVDNSNFLASQTYHRHQVPGPDFNVWDQFRGPDGKPLYPQRPMLLGPLFLKAMSGSVESGKFEGKMIVCASLWDREAMPWQADWYRLRVQQNLGDKTDDNFRIWYTDHALHGDEPGVEDANHTVSYLGVLQQALRDLSAWVEKGIAPPASTSYTVVDGQVIVPPTAAERKGIQPVVTLKANGGERAEVSVGQAVTFEGAIEVPPNTGHLVAVAWDFDGTGTFTDVEKFDKSSFSANVKATYTFAKPGTYYVALRATSQRDGDSKTPYARIPNLGRVRVVVH